MPTVTWAGPAGGTSSTLPRTPRRLAAGESPAQAREILTADDRRLEQVLLEIRLAEGMPLDRLSSRGRGRLDDLAARSLVVVTDDRLRLTLTGRLLADAIVRELVD